MQKVVLLLVLLIVIPISVAEREESRFERAQPIQEINRITVIPQDRAVEEATRTPRGSVQQEISVDIPQNEIPDVSVSDNVWINKGSSRTSLDCPKMKYSNMIIPKYPGETDCDIKDDAVKYLEVLEGIAKECNNKRVSLWNNMLKEKNIIKNQVDELLSVSAIKKSNVDALSDAQSIGCFVSTKHMQMSVDKGGIPPTLLDSNLFYLNHMHGEVEQFCRMVDEIMEPLVVVCNKISDEAFCQITDGKGISVAQKNYFKAKLENLNSLKPLKELENFYKIKLEKEFEKLKVDFKDFECSGFAKSFEEMKAQGKFEKGKKKSVPTGNYVYNTQRPVWLNNILNFLRLA